MRGISSALGSRRDPIVLLLVAALGVQLIAPTCSARGSPEAATLEAFPGSLLLIPLPTGVSTVETTIPGARIRVAEFTHVSVRQRAAISTPWTPTDIGDGLWAVLTGSDPPAVMVGRRYESRGVLRLDNLLVVPPGVLGEDPAVGEFASGVEDFEFHEPNGTLVLRMDGGEVLISGLCDNLTDSWLFLDREGGHLYRLKGGALGRYTLARTTQVNGTWIASVSRAVVLISPPEVGSPAIYLLDRRLDVSSEIPLLPGLDLAAVRPPSESSVRVLSLSLGRRAAALVSIPANVSVKTYDILADGQRRWRVRIVLPPETPATIRLPESPMLSGSEVRFSLRLPEGGPLNATVCLTGPPISASIVVPDAESGEVPMVMALPHLSEGGSETFGARVTVNGVLTLSMGKSLGVLPSIQLIGLNGSDVYARAGAPVRLVFEILNRGTRNATLREISLHIGGMNATLRGPANLPPNGAGVFPMELNLSPGDYTAEVSCEVLDEGFGMSLGARLTGLRIHVVETPMSIGAEVPTNLLPLVPFKARVDLTFGAPAQDVRVNLTAPEGLQVKGNLSLSAARVSANGTLSLDLRAVADRSGSFSLAVRVEATFPWGREEVQRTINVTVGSVPYAYEAVGPGKVAPGDLLNVSLHLSGPPGVATVGLPDGFRIVETSGVALGNRTVQFSLPGVAWMVLRADVEPGSYLIPVVVTVNNTIVAGEPLRVVVAEEPGLTRERLIGQLTELRRRVRTLRERSLLPWASSPAGLDRLERDLELAEREIEAGDYGSAAGTLSRIEEELSAIESAPRQELDPLVPLTITLLASSALLLWASVRWWGQVEG